MKITAFYNTESGCDYHRIILPIKFMKLLNGESIRLVHHKFTLADESIFDTDIVFLSRHFHCDFKIIESLKKKFGFKLVVDMDDYYKLPYHHLLYKGYQKFNVTERLIEISQKSDMIFVTNEQLYQAYKELNPNTQIVPNALPFEKEPFIPNKVEADRIRFIYVAGSTHLSDLLSIQGLFKRLSTDSTFKAKGNFTLCGYNNPRTEKDNVWNKIENICRIAQPYSRRPSLPLKNYIEHYNYGDVAIAPLEDTTFNRGKSQLKFVEAACMKLPFICSNILPYTKDYILKDKGIIFCNKSQDWYKAFRFFLNNPTSIEDYSSTNYEYAKNNYNLKDSNVLRLQLFRNTIL